MSKQQDSKSSTGSGGSSGGGAGSSADTKAATTSTVTHHTVIPTGEYDVYDVPRDATDPTYVLNFDLSEWFEIRRFFHTFGFVVIRRVLNDSECALTLSEVMDSLERGTNGKWNRNDRKTWGVWPAEGMEHYASPQKASIFTPQFLKVRTHPNVHAAFAVLFADGGADVSVDVKAAAAPAAAAPVAAASANGGAAGSDAETTATTTAAAAAAAATTAAGTGSGGTKPVRKAGIVDTAAVVAACEPLITNHDRANFFRPTDLNPKWATKPNLHLDMNAWNWLGSGDELRHHLDTLHYDRISNFINENNQASWSDGLQLQAAVNLLDNSVEDGGFICVPGFQSEFKSYYTNPKLSGQPKTERANVDYSPKDPLQKRAIRVTMRAGSIVIWDQRLPHGSWPNRGSSRPRSALLMKMFPARLISKSRAGYRAAAVRENIKRAMSDKQNPFVITELAKQLLGFNLPGAGAASAIQAVATPQPKADVSKDAGGGGAKSDKPDGAKSTEKK